VSEAPSFFKKLNQLVGRIWAGSRQQFPAHDLEAPLETLAGIGNPKADSLSDEGDDRAGSSPNIFEDCQMLFLAGRYEDCARWATELARLDACSRQLVLIAARRAQLAELYDALKRRLLFRRSLALESVALPRADAWQLTLVELSVGEKTLADVLDSIRTDAECAEVHYYWGARLLDEGDARAAVESFDNCVDSGRHPIWVIARCDRQHALTVLRPGTNNPMAVALRAIGKLQNLLATEESSQLSAVLHEAEISITDEQSYWESDALYTDIKSRIEEARALRLESSPASAQRFISEAEALLERAGSSRPRLQAELLLQIGEVADATRGEGAGRQHYLSAVSALSRVVGPAHPGRVYGLAKASCADGKDDNSANRRAVATSIVDTLLRGGVRGDRAREALEEARSLVKDDLALWREWGRGLVGLQLLANDLRGAQHTVQGLATAAESGDGFMLSLLRMQAEVHLASYDHRAAFDCAARMRAEASSVRDAEAMFESYYVASKALLGAGLLTPARVEATIAIRFLADQKGPNHVLLGKAYSVLARIEAELGNPDSERYQERALAIMREQRNQPVMLLECLTIAAEDALHRGQPAAALELVREIRETCEGLGLLENTLKVGPHRIAADALLALERFDEAFQEWFAAEQLAEERIVGNLLVASAAQRLERARALRADLGVGVGAFAGVKETDRDRVGNYLCDIIIRRKGFATEVDYVHRRELWAHEESSLAARAKALVDETDVGVVEREERALARLIPSLVLKERLFAPSVGAVVAALPKGVGLIEIFRFGGGKAKLTKTEQYGAVVIAPEAEHPLRCITLGRVIDVDKAVRNFQRALAAWDGEGRVQAAGLELARTALAKLIPHLVATGRWIVAPDGELTRISLESVPIDATTYLADCCEFTYVSHARDLVRPRDGAKPGTPVVLCSPDFGEPKNGTSDAPGGEREFRPLIHAASEGVRVAELLGVEPVSGRGADVVAIRRHPNPRVLHLATHGFFLPESAACPPEEVEPPAGAWPAMISAERVPALLRSGLALAGANEAPQPEGAGAILWAKDVLSLDLRGTELVFLSACESGLGDIVDAEGVVGLRRAFRIAGAATVVLALWHVDDFATYLLVEEFYRNFIQRGLSPSGSLRAAQRYVRGLTMREIRATQLPRELEGYSDISDDTRLFASPVYWGAFVCEGDAGEPCPE
jgi:hypothetical protein